MVIAFFDSGIGGLTVLKHAIRELPNHDFIYYADTKNAPYGVKTKEHVRKHVFEAVDYIAKHDIQALVIACNTATAVAITDLRHHYPFHIVGMEPAVKPAVIRNRGKNILVLATSLTLKASKLEALIASVDKNNKTVKMEMDALVGFAESWDFNSGNVKKYIQDKLRTLRVAELETIVLGCTHFIYYKSIIQEVVGDEIKIIDGNIGTVANLKNVLSGFGVQHDQNGGHVLFYSSGVRDDVNREIKLRGLMGCQ
ncbi:MAG: glutamate racemase [Verrucomicrobia bacterium]|nr:glutamate racemase [Verrucomicrobiota bacterium]MCG2681856.1 glutamate racemase [Kiritimatiellia bacterium]MBU4247736.1 glutamate racemase [Verrucomicrobiota bacterium]MBU4291612.1 glutamate racemase [Verrucomicrobiota bacterium]MBU4429571.1 glutamate racemase [Verrucomicrobiota bacterium]